MGCTLLNPNRMDKRYEQRIQSSQKLCDTGIWSSPTFSVDCIVSLHCSASQISAECCLEVPMGLYGDLWGPMGTYGDLWRPLGTYGGLWGPMGAYGDL